tara:strand:- start:64 stop:351 length:288 start_codon:yes stop_codon:yes gene_type:complete
MAKSEMIIKIDLDMTERELLKEVSKRSKALEKEVQYDYVRDEIMNSSEPNMKKMYMAIRALEDDVRKCKIFLTEVSHVIDTYHTENDKGSMGNVQ